MLRGLPKSGIASWEKLPAAVAVHKNPADGRERGLRLRLNAPHHLSGATPRARQAAQASAFPQRTSTERTSSSSSCYWDADFLFASPLCPQVPASLLLIPSDLTTTRLLQTPQEVVLWLRMAAAAPTTHPGTASTLEALSLLPLLCRRDLLRETPWCWY